ncbi:MAG: LTA synthase family protein [Bacillota bacterium]|nr:LTA synthase family protein [Bacillota bacterium]
MELAAEKTLRGAIGFENCKRTALIVFLFIAISTVKITAFNIFILSTDSLQIFLYKFGITFLLITSIYLILMGFKSKIPFLIFYIIQLIYIFINLIYYGYFHSYLHFSQAFALFSEGVGAAGDLSTLLSPKLLIALLDVPLAIYLLISYPGISKGIRQVKRINRAVLISGCLMIITLTEGWNYLHNYSIVNIAKANNSASEALVVQRYGTFANSLADMILNKNDNSLLSQLKYGQHITGKGTEGTKPNFIMIQVESMDANAVNKQHDGQYVMPFLHSLAQQNVYYPYTMSYHEAGGTSDAEFSTMNSVQPLSDYPSIDINNYSYPNSVVRQLVNNSYTTVAFHGNIGSYFNRNNAYPKMGYQQLVDMTKMGLGNVGWGAPDGAVFSYEEKQLKTIKQPFFSYTITMTSHGPFTNANNYYNNSLYNDVKDPTARCYMNSMSYVDQSLENFVNYIKENFKNTYIFIWGDHTPNVKNSEYMQASFTDSDKYFEFVPLIIVTPDGKQYTENKSVASFLDVAPTVANASGIPYSIDSDGMDLLNRPVNVNEIPYRGGIFDRSILFSKVSQVKP